MKFYRIREPFAVDPVYEIKGQVEITGKREWGLPGITCWGCSKTYGVIGHEYPCIEPTLEQREYLADHWPKYPEWHKEAQSKLGLELPDGSPLRPGTDFGMLKGKIKGRVLTDFIWPWTWTILVRQNVKELLAESVLRLSGFRGAQIKGSERFNEKFHEIQIEKGLLLDESCMIRQRADCEVCGSSGAELRSSAPLKLKNGSSSLQHDLFRVGNATTRIIASEAFRTFCEKHSFTNIMFFPVELM